MDMGALKLRKTHFQPPTDTGGLYPAPAGGHRRPGAALALGTPAARASALPISCSSGLFCRSAHRGHTGKRPKTLRSLARTDQRPAVGPSTTPSTAQEECLILASSRLLSSFPLVRHRGST